MTKRHRYFPISKVTEGMVLAEDLLDKVGHVLLPAGTSLSARMLQSILQHDVLQLSIALPPLSDTEQQEQSQQTLARVEQVFRLTADQSPARELKQYVLQYHQKDIAESS